MAIQSSERVVAQLVRAGEVPRRFLVRATGRRHGGLSKLQDASSILAGSFHPVQARMGVGRAPPDTVAQQRITEHGVAAPAPMVHEDGMARTHDDAMRVRVPPVRAPSPCDGARTPRHQLACTASRRGPTREGYLVLIGFESRLATSQLFTRAGRRLSVIPVMDTLA
jgi:hypothetical protein